MGMGGTILVIGLAVIGLLSWFIADLNHDRRWSRKRAELGAQSRWKELNEHFEAGLKCRRPLLVLFRAMVGPGLLEADYALHLSNQGEHEKALVWADRAVRKSAQRKRNLDMTSTARAHILCRMGRYEEARAAAAQANSFNPQSASADLVEGMIELSLGRIDAALALGQKAMNHERAKDPARALVSGALALKGRFQEAVNVLVYEPANALDFFSPEALQQVTCDELGKGLVLAMDEEVAGIFRPARHLGVAQVCLEAGDTENLGRALDRVERELKSHPVVEHIYYRLRACCCALKADAPGTENNLVRARTLADEVPSRSAKYETHQFAGRAYLLLGRSEAALSELRAAAQLALHPLEKHATNYWLARGAEAAGHGQEAARIFSLVTADGFDTWMSAQAGARLNSSRGTEGPGSRRLTIGE